MFPLHCEKAVIADSGLQLHLQSKIDLKVIAARLPGAGMCCCFTKTAQFCSTNNIDLFHSLVRA